MTELLKVSGKTFMFLFKVEIKETRVRRKLTLF